LKINDQGDVWELHKIVFTNWRFTFEN